MKKYTFILLVIFAIAKIPAQTVTDIDGNVYHTITVGTQDWLIENLATTRLNDGTPIPLVTDSIAWFNLSSPGYCWYKNDSSTYKIPYGALYNWYTVNTGNLCPVGWHVPTNTDWHTLVLFLDPAAQDCYCTESAIAGNDLKESGLSHWGNGNNGTNSSGFTALGAGFRNYFNKAYQGLTAVTYYWTSTSNDPYPTVWHRWLQNNSANVYEYLDKKTQGMSVRCLKDNTTGIMNNTDNINIIKVYPNPASNHIFVDCSDKEQAKMKVYNMIGECMLQIDLNSGLNDIDISSWSNGMYVIRISGNNWTTQNIFTKE